MGVMIDNMSAYAQGDSTRNIWLPVVAYAVLLFVNGDAGIGWIRKWLWLPLEQRSYVALSTASQAHIMSLSSDFHESDNKNTSDLMQAATTGRSVIDLLETICFQVVPMFVDSVIAFGYLWFLFGPFMGLIVATTFFSYLYITAKFIAATAEQRRQYTAVHRKEYIVGHQSLESWNIASLFNMIPHEQQRYERAVNSHMSSKRIQEFSSQYMNAAQSLTMTCGLIGGLYLATFQVAKEGKSIGELTTFLAYWAQLQGPLFFFSSVFKTIFHRLMDAERLLELFKMKPTVTDTPDAKPLALRKGEIKFDHVSFAYDVRKPILKNVNFVVPAGKTVALVGPTGSGKSTMLKLLDRFYDVKSGCISIDGQDIRAVTLKSCSLRDNIGVVPQEPMLFNDSIMNNIRYARLTASTEEIHNACRAAALHDKIMTFPDRYYTKIGDRGVKLSGGEKQRIAIARAILKRPEIILLDEATSAVDTETEHTIREGFKKLCEDRTTIIVAHRLSTIMQSDRILVVIDGEIIEEGSHHELIRARGKYHDLWSKQVFVEPEVEQPNPVISQTADCILINDLGADDDGSRSRRMRQC
ncbi:hypothetical protein OIDMADRAFT_196334 [Oidiodendron maius Zn]|uniref:ABC transporter domain-containing protein n=1 Tax=Oidiodendron maius (strain Zn) TaxID=913774 RepID=A0A0C3HHH5_OIDMZ|nr:hypothetical protein OIDMADRAFT_196334 [Oidiodendron maius Zn]